jgi:hypothetical protein
MHRSKFILPGSFSFVNATTVLELRRDRNYRGPAAASAVSAPLMRGAE